MAEEMVEAEAEVVVVELEGAQYRRAMEEAAEPVEVVAEAET